MFTSADLKPVTDTEKNKIAAMTAQEHLDRGMRYVAESRTTFGNDARRYRDMAVMELLLAQTKRMVSGT